MTSTSTWAVVFVVSKIKHCLFFVQNIVNDISFYSDKMQNLRTHSFLRFVLCCMFLCDAPILAYCQYAHTKTYYYECTKLVNKDKTTVTRSGDGQFYTITSNACYESDSDGFDQGLGVLKYLYYNQEKQIHIYDGKCYYGNATFYFNADYSHLNILTESGCIYVFARTSAPKGVTTSNHKEFKQKVDAFLAGGAMPTMQAPAIQSTTGSYQSQTRTHRPCPGCGGSGFCTMCKGKGWYKNIYDSKIYNCPSCNSGGRCKVCYGKGYVD